MSTPKFRQEIVKIPSATPNWLLDAWTYIPEKALRPCPVIVMAHGLGCNKQLGLSSYAEAFASVGYACVVFDFRRWGASDGFPRNCVVVSDQIQDYKTVVGYCRHKEEFDSQRIILWGYSFSGGHVLSLSADPALNIYVTIAQTPYCGRPFGFTLTLTCFRRIFFALADLISQRLGLGAVYTRTSAPLGEVGAVTAPGAVAGFLSLPRAAFDFPNQISASIYLLSPFYQPALTASAITLPILLIAARNDNICLAERIRRVSQVAPKAELAEISGGHFDMFPGGSDFETCLASQLDFLRKYIPV